MSSGRSSSTLPLDAPATVNPRNRNAELGIMVVLHLVLFGVVTITTVATFFGVGFLLLVEEMPASRIMTHEALPAPPKQTAAPHEVSSNDSASPAALASPVSPRPFAAHGQPAVHQGIVFCARLRFLRQQQAQLELQLTKPGLSAAETTRLERQKAYWGDAIERMLDSP